MMEQIFHDGKKGCVGDQKLRDWINKKPMRKNVVAIDNVLWGKLQCFSE